LATVNDTRAGNPAQTQGLFGKRNFTGKSLAVDDVPLRCWKCREVGHKSSAHKGGGLEVGPTLHADCELCCPDT